MKSQVSELNDSLLNICSNYIPNKTVLCEEKDPPWLTNGIRTVIEMKNNAQKKLGQALGIIIMYALRT